MGSNKTAARITSELMRLSFMVSIRIRYLGLITAAATVRARLMARTGRDRASKPAAGYDAPRPPSIACDSLNPEPAIHRIWVESSHIRST